MGGSGLAVNKIGDATRSVPARLRLAAIRVADAHQRLSPGVAGRFQQDHLVASDPGPPIRQPAYSCCLESDRAAAKVEQVMQANPEITGWAMIGGWPLFTDDALKWAPGTVKCVSVDALPAELAYLRSGHVQMLLAQQVYEWGTKSVDMLYDKVAENKNPPSTFVKGELIPVTKDNVEEYAENWKKWLPKK